MQPSPDLVRAIDLVLKNVQLFSTHFSDEQDPEQADKFDKLKLLCIEKVLQF